MHKAGIIKKDLPVVVGQMNDEALRVIQETATKQSASLYTYGKQFWMENDLFEGTKSFKIDTLNMKGAHQRVNASVAIEALLQAGICLDETNIGRALASAKLSHRFEEIYPNVFLDGAHNPAAANALRSTIEEQFPGEKVDFIVGMLARKDLKGTLDALLPVARSFTLIEFDHPEAARGEVLMRNCHHPQKRVTKLKNHTIILSNEQEVKKVITGSLYLLASLSIELR